MIAFITERVITVDSTKSNAGEGEGYFSRTPPAWMWCMFPRDKRRLCLLALGPRERGALAHFPPRQQAVLIALEAGQQRGCVRARGQDKTPPSSSFIEV